MRALDRMPQGTEGQLTAYTIDREELGSAVIRAWQRGCQISVVLDERSTLRGSTRDQPALTRRMINAGVPVYLAQGRALGPEAAIVARTLFMEFGYDVLLRSTPWRLSGLKDQDLTLALVRGWIEAAVEVLPNSVELIHAWGNRRCEEVRGNEYELEVGHYDLLALPPVDAD